MDSVKTGEQTLQRNIADSANWLEGIQRSAETRCDCRNRSAFATRLEPREGEAPAEP